MSADNDVRSVLASHLEDSVCVRVGSMQGWALTPIAAAIVTQPALDKVASEYPFTDMFFANVDNWFANFLFQTGKVRRPVQVFSAGASGMVFSPFSFRCYFSRVSPADADRLKLVVCFRSVSSSFGRRSPTGFCCRTDSAGSWFRVCLSASGRSTSALSSSGTSGPMLRRGGA